MLSTLSLNNIEFVKYILELRQLKRVTSLFYEAVWTGGWLQTDSGVRGARSFVSLVLYWRWLRGSFSCAKVDWCTAQAIISSITLMQGGIPLDLQKWQLNYRILSPALTAPLIFISNTGRCYCLICLYFVCVEGILEEGRRQRERMLTMSVYLYYSGLPGWTSLPVSVDCSSDQRVYLLTT